MDPFSTPPTFIAKRVARSPTCCSAWCGIDDRGASRDTCPLAPRAPRRATLAHRPQGHPRRGRSRSSSHSLRGPSARSGQKPRESLDPPEALPKEAPRQAPFGQWHAGVPGLSDEAPAGLEEPRLPARQRPALDGTGQGTPAPELAEIGGDDPEAPAYLGGPEAMTGQAGPVGGGVALLDPLLHRPTPVGAADDAPVPPGQGGAAEAPRGKSSPRCCSSVAITRRGRSQEAA